MQNIQMRQIIGFAISLALGLGLVTMVQARVLLTQDAALQQMFGETDKILTRTCVMSQKEIVMLQKMLGGKLIHFQEGAAQDIQEVNEYTFYVGVRKNKKIGVALIEDQPGKWGPVRIIIALNPETGKVQNLAIMSYTEVRGRPIARRSFLNQFVGKGTGDPISIRSDIRAITGATISSDATSFAVRKTVTIYEEVFKK